MKYISMILIAAALTAGLSACHGGKKTMYSWSLYHELKKELPDAQVLRAGDSVRVIYPELTMFDFGKDEIKPAARPSFVRFARVLNRYGGIHFLINGYTDNVGTDQVNMSLSRNRAENARLLLSENGVAETRMSTNGRGAANPLKSNTTEEGRKANRRVEFLLYDTTPGTAR